MGPRWLPLTYGIVRTFLRLAMWIITRTTIEGLEHLPVDGPVILAPNHLSMVDPPLLCAMLPRQITFMSKAENDRGILWLFQRMTGTFSIRRGAIDRRAIGLAEQWLRAGHVLCVFPEGTRSRSGALGPGRGGIALLALQTGAPIVPIGLTGTNHVLRKGFPWLRLGRQPVRLRIGAPIQQLSDGETRQEVRRQMTDDVMRRIAELLPSEQRGFYRDMVAPPAAGQSVRDADTCFS